MALGASSDEVKCQSEANNSGVKTKKRIKRKAVKKNRQANNKTAKDEEEKEKDEAEDKNKDEVVFIQDIGFSVKIHSPGAEPFDIQVSSMELVQEIHQLLMDREDTCHRTCFSLQLDGNTLDNFAELKNVEGLKEGSVIKVVEEPYTMREARIHVRHVRDLLKSLDPADAYNGVECNSLSFLNTFTMGDLVEKKKMRPESVDCTPPDFIMPDSKDRPLTALQPQFKDQKAPQCVKVLTTSAWNPPPGYRKIHGDLMYLYVVTLEDKHTIYLHAPEDSTSISQQQKSSILNRDTQPPVSLFDRTVEPNITTVQAKLLHVTKEKGSKASL
nr:unnamed protein product [Callosobruchus analis]